MTWDTIYWGNTLYQYAFAATLFVALWLSIWVFKRVVIVRLRRLAEKTVSDFDDFLVDQIGKIRGWTFTAVALYASGHSLALPDGVDRALWLIVVALLTIRGVLFLTALINYGAEKVYFKGQGRDPAGLAAIRNVVRIVQWGLWAGAVLFFLDNLDFDITTAVAGLGIGGIAIAIAAQAILGDLFSSFSILMDKPFQIGDFIIVGDQMGTVEHIGLKTTRLRSLSGEQLVFSNADLTSSRIRNFKRMSERRVVFKLGVVYETPMETVERIPGMLRELLQSIPGARLDRAHFASYGDFSLVFEVVYYVASPDYNMYMDLQQQVNLAIGRRFAQEGIQFAYPTQTLHIRAATGS